MWEGLTWGGGPAPSSSHQDCGRAPEQATGAPRGSVSPGEQVSMQELESIRNIGIIAHIDAGKTTTTEGMLFYSGLTHRFGSIDDGTTVMDYLEDERDRGITIVAAAATLPWDRHLLHLIDTPGHIDFTAEVERSLRVIDGAVVIFSGVEGVEAQSEKVWRQAEHYAVPRLAFVNKLDRVGASFPRVLEEINRSFGELAVALQMPVGIEEAFETFIDLVRFELVSFSGPNNEQVVRGPVPDELLADASAEREHLIERLADESDEVAALYLDGEDVPAVVLDETIRRLTVERTIVPVLLGSAKRRIGVQPLMAGIIKYLPSPADCPGIPATEVKKGTGLLLQPDPSAPFSGLIFKVVARASADLLYVRTYAGTLRKNATVFNPRTRQKLRVKQLLRLYAKNSEALEKAGPGDIVAVVGPRDCGTGDTLTDLHRQVVFEKITFPEPVLSEAVEPRYSRDKDRLDEALGLLCREDPTLSLGRDEETGQRILGGMGELHLEISLGRLAREHNLAVRAGEPRVAYRETLRQPVEERSVFAKTLGDNELFAEATIAFRPLPRGDQVFRISSELGRRSTVPKAFVATAEKALADGLRTGGCHGYPLVYVEAELLDMRVHDEKTTEGAVVGAVLMAVDHAIRRAGTAVLEPLMSLEILAPDATVGEITTYLHGRRAIIHELEPLGGSKQIRCEVPLAELFGFGKALPKLSGGRATFNMMPCGYQELPPDVTERLFGFR